MCIEQTLGLYVVCIIAAIAVFGLLGVVVYDSFEKRRERRAAALRASISMEQSETHQPPARPRPSFTVKSPQDLMRYAGNALALTAIESVSAQMRTEHRITNFPVRLHPDTHPDIVFGAIEVLNYSGWEVTVNNGSMTLKPKI